MRFVSATATADALESVCVIESRISPMNARSIAVRAVALGSMDGAP